MSAPAFVMKKPRAEKGASELLRKPGSNVKLVGLQAGADAAVAVLSWTNPPLPAGRRRRPASVDIEAVRVEVLRSLPRSAAQPGSSDRSLDVEATRELLRGALPAESTPDAPVLVYTRDKMQATEYGAPELVAKVARSQADLQVALGGVPHSYLGSVKTSVLARKSALHVTLKREDQDGILERARALFPLAADRLRNKTRDGMLAHVLLLLGHVIGASLAPGNAAAAAAGAGAAPDQGAVVDPPAAAERAAPAPAAAERAAPAAAERAVVPVAAERPAAAPAPATAALPPAIAAAGGEQRAAAASRGARAGAANPHPAGPRSPCPTSARSSRHAKRAATQSGRGQQGAGQPQLVVDLTQQEEDGEGGSGGGAPVEKRQRLEVVVLDD